LGTIRNQLGMKYWNFEGNYWTGKRTLMWMNRRVVARNIYSVDDTSIYNVSWCLKLVFLQRHYLLHAI